MENTLKSPTYPIYTSMIERSRTKVLTVGYHIVVFKSKFKKRLLLLKRMIIEFNT